MTCGSGGERTGKRYPYFPELPCDINKNSWCESAGTQYPWSAVRRFVYENQGLMKRMYGNQRHYNVLRSELLNDLYEEMFDEMPKRHHQYRHPSPPSARTARYQNPSRSNTLNSKSSKLALKERDELNSRAMKVTMEPDYGDLKQQAPTTERIKPNSKFSKAQTKGTSSGANNRMNGSATRIPTTTAKTTRTTIGQTPTSGETSDPSTTVTEEALTTSNSQWVEEMVDTVALPTREYLSVVEEETQPTVLPSEPREVDPFEVDMWTTLVDSSTDAADSSYSTPYSNSGLSETYSSYTSVTVPETSTLEPSTSRSDLLFDNLESDDGQFSEGFISTPLDQDDLTTLTLSDRVVQDMKNNNKEADFTKDEIDLGIEAALGEDVGGKHTEEAADMLDKGAVVTESGNLKVEVREQVVDELTVEGNVREEVKTEPPSEPFKMKRPVRGINACPVKEEFVAPYWANNTRGETLALLNLYPFEQYVQWERCMYEHRQMYCRAGCRCEQQYRLHKLLAFDPTNECRGIFSDWFRFPSCCVCKCYDLPQDLFTMPKQRRPRLNQDEEEEEDKEYEDYFEDESEEVEAEFGEERRQLPIRPGPPLANIPPQRRPRLPPRPHSHVSAPSLGLVPPPPSPRPPPRSPPPPPRSPPSSPNTLPSASISLGHWSPTESPELSTLGTVDIATPHYYFNISNYARILFSKGHPLPLSRLPRSPEE